MFNTVPVGNINGPTYINGFIEKNKRKSEDRVISTRMGVFLVLRQIGRKYFLTFENTAKKQEQSVVVEEVENVEVKTFKPANKAVQQKVRMKNAALVSNVVATLVRKGFKKKEPFQPVIDRGPVEEIPTEVMPPVQPIVEPMTDVNPQVQAYAPVQEEAPTIPEAPVVQNTVPEIRNDEPTLTPPAIDAVEPTEIERTMPMTEETIPVVAPETINQPTIPVETQAPVEEIKAPEQPVLSPNVDDYIGKRPKLDEELEDPETLLSSFGQINTDFDAAMQRANKAEETIASMQQKLDALTVTLTDAQNKNAELTHSLKNVEDELTTAKATADAQKNRADKAVQDAATVQEKVAGLEEQLSAKTNEANRWKANYATLATGLRNIKHINQGSTSVEPDGMQRAA